MNPSNVNEVILVVRFPYTGRAAPATIRTARIMAGAGLTKVQVAVDTIGQKVIETLRKTKERGKTEGTGE